MTFITGPAIAMGLIFDPDIFISNDHLASQTPFAGQIVDYHFFQFLRGDFSKLFQYGFFLFG